MTASPNLCHRQKSGPGIASGLCLPNGPRGEKGMNSPGMNARIEGAWLRGTGIPTGSQADVANGRTPGHPTEFRIRDHHRMLEKSAHMILLSARTNAGLSASTALFRRNLQAETRHPLGYASPLDAGHANSLTPVGSCLTHSMHGGRTQDWAIRLSMPGKAVSELHGLRSKSDLAIAFEQDKRTTVAILTSVHKYSTSCLCHLHERRNFHRLNGYQFGDSTS